MPSTTRWYYNRACDVVVVVTYTLVHMGRINNLVKVPPVPTPTNLLEFLRPPLEPIVPEIPVLVTEISSSNSHIPATEPC